MILKDARDAYYGHSGKASDVARQLAFAGIAVIWIFRVAEPKTVRLALPDELLEPLFFFVLCLLLDFLHYAYAAAAWGIFHRSKEKAFGHDEAFVFEAPRWINWPATTFFVFKIVATAVAYVLLLTFVGNRL